MRGYMGFFVSVTFAVFALPAIADQPLGAGESATVSSTQERSIRGVVEAIDARAERIQLSGKDYAFSPAKVRVTTKSGKVPSSALRVGDRIECVVIDDGATQHVTEVWVQT
jgi:hypothetical protein